MNCIFCPDEEVYMIQELVENSGPPINGSCRKCKASYNDLSMAENPWFLWSVHFNYEDENQKKWVVKYHLSISHTPLYNRLDIFSHERRFKPWVTIKLTGDNIKNPLLTPFNIKEKFQTYITFS